MHHHYKVNLLTKRFTLQGARNIGTEPPILPTPAIMTYRPQCGHISNFHNVVILAIWNLFYAALLQRLTRWSPSPQAHKRESQVDPDLGCVWIHILMKSDCELRNGPITTKISCFILTCPLFDLTVLPEHGTLANGCH